ncbi:hypothetical protein [Paenibacillus physcomitrellae]|uniref:ABC transporter permease n=1 Tax=Paenibacillus physcomitrellae TaxID=1619311 RepID=A0ABQ1GR86_9BACL|nr:hypothetical protein [Paenibacillus physcomitrellae]GGA48862.1 hypothetical protein GCM10010917_37680 [Paenibacillus physcomitrellae]
MKEFRTLKLLDKIRAPLEKIGVQYPELRLILQVKLTMDGRRVPTVGAGMFSRSKERNGSDNQLSSQRFGEELETGNRFIRSLWLYVLIGLVLLPFMLIGDNYLFQMSVSFSILFFMVTSSLISDFSSVLLDIRDKTILLSRPVNAKTINLAKMIHILIYLSYITAAVTLPSLIAALFKHGFVFLLVYLAEIILMDFFIVALTALLYFLVLRLFNGEVLKDIINYVQIGLTIVLMVGYQLVFRLFDLSGFAVHFEPKIWQYLLPPVWFAGPFEVLFNGEHSGIYVSFALLALLVPILSLTVYTLLMPRFEQHLQKLSEQGDGGRNRTSHFHKRLGSWICRTKEEAVFFDFASIMLRRERDFKLKVYPSLGLSIVFPFIFMLINFKEGKNWAEISSGQSYLFIYFCTIMVPTVIMTLKYSGNYKGAWIYTTAPLIQIKDLYKGTLKAFLMRLLLPLFLVEAIIFMAIFGLRILPDLLVVLLVIFLYTYISFLLIGRELPFSRRFETVPEEGAGMKTLGLLAILGVFALLHFLSLRFSYGVYGYLVILLAVNFWVWRRGFEFRDN